MAMKALPHAQDRRPDRSRGLSAADRLDIRAEQT